MILAGDVYDAVLMVEDDEDEAVEFSSSNCCTCRISTYSSSWFCDADDVDEEAAAAEINEEFGRLPFRWINEKKKLWVILSSCLN